VTRSQAAAAHLAGYLPSTRGCGLAGFGRTRWPWRALRSAGHVSWSRRRGWVSTVIVFAVWIRGDGANHGGLGGHVADHQPIGAALEAPIVDQATNPQVPGR